LWQTLTTAAHCLIWLARGGRRACVGNRLRKQKIIKQNVINNSTVAMYCCTMNPISIHIQSLYFTVVSLHNPRINKNGYQFLEDNPLMDDEKAETFEITKLLILFITCYSEEHDISETGCVSILRQNN
jgi:hypothetical protein